MLFKKDTISLNELLTALTPIVEAENVHVQTRRVRGGNIIAFSLEAIAESTMDRIISEREAEMTFVDRINRAFLEAPPIEESDEPVDFEAQAAEIVETNLATNSATGGMGRSNQTTRERQKFGSQRTYGGVDHPAAPDQQKKRKRRRVAEAEEAPVEVDKGAAKGPAKGPSKGPASRRVGESYEIKVCDALEIPRSRSGNEFGQALAEALDGMATPTGHQPDDLFGKFSRALQVVGDQVGIGPLQDRLKEQGINWMKSQDGLSVILYVVNGQTGAKQPIARISHETLDNPNDFQEQLTNMLDFAHAKAPGTTAQERQRMQDQEKAIRDVASAVAPQDQESEVAKQMHGSAGAQAATTAASPKPALQGAQQRGMNQVATRRAPQQRM
jgi:hypothetical protein